MRNNTLRQITPPTPFDASLLQPKKRPATKTSITPLAFTGNATRVVVLSLFALFFGLPLLWLLLAPTRTNQDLLIGFPISFGSFENVAISWQRLTAYNNGEILNWVTNSLIYSGGGLLLTLVLTIPAGYVLATIPIRGRSFLLITTLVVMIMPGGATVLPLFLEMNALQLVNTPLSIILPSAFFPFGVYLTYIYFSTSVPVQLLDAARVDGCSEFRVFWDIALPLATPIISLVAFFSFVGNWNNYFLPYVMLTDGAMYNLPVGLAVLFSNAPGIHPAFATELEIFGPEIALAGIMVVFPVLILFLFSQRALVAGMVGGAVKE